MYVHAGVPSAHETLDALAAEVYVPFWAKEREVGAGISKGKQVIHG